MLAGPGCAAERRVRWRAPARGGMIAGSRLEMASDPIVPPRASPTTAPTGAAGAAPGRDLPPRFTPGSVLAQRYRIERFIARGGMGEVYEALDLALQERVALKTLRSAGAADAEAVERFKREIQLARRVTHRNVSRIFELGFHREPGAAAETLFLTMELLPGQTLADHLAAHGPLRERAALPLVQQVVAGLAAAHEAAIVHRDLKSHNVLLVSERGGLRAVVTDFGIALAPGSEPPEGDQPVAGSPAYMAPEQVAGLPVGPAADIYALGVLLFEMVTGRWPFEDPDPLRQAFRRLTEPPPSPRQFVPRLRASWERVILRCLERQPQDRYADAREVLRDLAGGGARWRRHALLAAALLGGGLAVLLPLRHSVVERSLSSHPVVAVLGARPGAGVPAWQAQAFDEALTAALGADPGLRVLSPQTVAESAVDLGLAPAETSAPETLQQLRRRAGAELVLAGLLGSDPAAGLQLALRLQQTCNGAERRALQLSAPAGPADGAALAALASQAADVVRDELGRREPAPTAPAARGALGVQPTGLAAYVEGLHRLRRFDMVAARERLTTAAEAEPASPHAQLALARLWLTLHQDEAAREAGRRALAALASLPPGPQRDVEAEALVAAGEWRRALALLRPLQARQPRLETGLLQARAELASGQAVAAGATLARLRELEPPEGDDPRLALFDVEVGWTEDFERARSAAERALHDAERRGARLAQADALVQGAQVAWMRGDLAGALSGAERARILHVQLGHRLRLAEDLNVLMAVHWQQGHLARSAALARESVASFADLGVHREEANNLSNLAFVLVRQGLWREALQRFAEARALREPADPWQGLPFLGEGWVAALTGRLDDAERAYAAAQQRLERFAEPYPLVFLRVRSAELRAARGAAVAARASLEQAGELAAARGLRAMVAEARLAESVLMLRLGRPAEAESQARAALGEARQAEARHLEAMAQGRLARALLERGERPAALAAAGEAGRLADQQDDLLSALLAGTDSARVACLAQEGHSAEALGHLERWLALARELAFVQPELEAGLARAACQQHAGQAGAARLALDAVARRARAAGFTALAAEAEEQRQPHPRP